MEGNEKVTRNNWDGGVQVENEPNAGKYTDNMRSNMPFPMAALTIMPTQEAYNYVLANAGATLPKRDAVDARVVEQVRTGEIKYNKNVKLPETQFKHRRLPIDSYKGGIITDVSQVGGYPTYKGKAYKDSDSDGMPDDWEKKYNLNPKNPADAVADLNGDGYTNIEKYIHSIDPKKKVNWKDPKNNTDTFARN